MKKTIILIISIVLVAFAAYMYVGVSKSLAERQDFTSDGYVIQPEIEGLDNDRIYFNSGTEYLASSTDEISFTDNTDNKYSVSNDSIVHYNDGAFFSFSDSNILLLNELIGTGLSNSYDLIATTVIENSNGVYTVDNMGDTLEFEDFLVKSSDTKYMLVSDSIEIALNSTNTVSAESYIEIEYVDEGIMTINTPEASYQTISNNVTATTENGYTINLSNQEILFDDISVLGLNRMVLDADDNIEILPYQNRQFTVPKINIEAIDGEDGKDGLSGTDGDSGGRGSSGGVGQTGAEGGDGTEPESSATTKYPVYAIETKSIGSTDVDLEILEVDDANAIINDAHYVLYNDYTNEIVIPEFQVDLVSNPNLPLQFDSLSPDTRYRLVLTVSFSIGTGTDQQNFELDLVSKTFITLGKNISMSLGNVTQNDFDLYVKDTTNGSYILYLFNDLKTAESFSKDNISGHYGSYTGIQGQSKYVASSFTPVTGTLAISPNSNYYVRLQIVNGATLEEVIPQILEVSTLKAKPDLSGATLSVTSNPFEFGFEVITQDIIDNDSAITEYVYSIYEKATSGDFVKVGTKIAKDSASVIFNVDGTIIESSKEYYFDVEIKYNDNQSNSNSIVPVRSVDTIPNPVGPYVIDGGKLPIITFNKNTSTSNFETIQGILEITRGDDVNWGRGIEIQMSAPGVNTYTYTIPGTGLDIDPTGTSALVDFNSGGVYNLLGLNSDTSYLFKVFGYLNGGSEAVFFGGFTERTDSQVVIWADFGDGPPNSGNVISATLELKPLLEADFNTVYANLNHVVNGVKIDPNDSNGYTLYLDAYKKQTRKIYDLSIKLYSGSGSNKVEIAEYSASDVSFPQDNILDLSTNGEQFVVSDYSTKWNTKVQPITEARFGGASIAGNVFTLEVVDVVDYTPTVFNTSTGVMTGITSSGGENKIDTNFITVEDYYNRFPIYQPKGTYSTNIAPPPLEGDGFDLPNVNAIKNSQATNYGLTYDQSLPGSAIIGYDVQSNFNNSASLARTMTYYMFETKAFEGFDPTGRSVDPDFIVQYPHYLQTSPIDQMTSGYYDENYNGVYFGMKGAELSYSGISSPRYIFLLGGTRGTTGLANNIPTIQTGLKRGYDYTFSYNAGLGINDSIKPNYSYPQDTQNYVFSKIEHVSSNSYATPKADYVLHLYPYFNDENVSSWKYFYYDVDNIASNPELLVNNTPYSLLGNDLLPGYDNVTLVQFADVGNKLIDYPGVVNNSTVITDNANKDATLDQIKNSTMKTLAFYIDQTGSTTVSFNGNKYDSSYYNHSNPSFAPGVDLSNKGGERFNILIYNHPSKETTPVDLSTVLVTQTLLQAQYGVQYNITVPDTLEQDFFKDNAGIVFDYSNGTKNLEIIKPIPETTNVPVYNDGNDTTISIFISLSEFIDFNSETVRNLTTRISTLKGGYKIGLSNVVNNDNGVTALGLMDKTGTIVGYNRINTTETGLEKIMSPFNAGASIFSKVQNTISYGKVFNATASTNVKAVLNDVDVTALMSSYNIGSNGEFIVPVELIEYSVGGNVGNLQLPVLVPVIDTNVLSSINNGKFMDTSVLGVEAGILDIYASVEKRDVTTGNYTGAFVNDASFVAKDNANNIIASSTSNHNISVNGNNISVAKLPISSILKPNTLDVANLQLDSEYRVTFYVQPTVSSPNIVIMNDPEGNTNQWIIKTTSSIDFTNAQVYVNNISNQVKNLVAHFEVANTLDYEIKFEVKDLSDNLVATFPEYIESNINLQNTITIPMGAGTINSIYRYLEYDTDYKLVMTAIDLVNSLPIPGTEKEFPFSMDAWEDPNSIVVGVSALVNDGANTYPDLSLNITAKDDIRAIFKDEIYFEIENATGQVVYTSDKTNFFDSKSFIRERIETISENGSTRFVFDGIYTIKVYGVLDTLTNGTEPGGNPLTDLGTLVNAANWDTVKSNYEITQPGGVDVRMISTDGYRFETPTVERDGNKIKLVFTNAAGLDAIKTITYTVQNGGIFTTNTFTVEPADIIEKDKYYGVYEIYIEDFIFTSANTYSIIAQLKGASGTLLTNGSVSGIIVYD